LARLLAYGTEVRGQRSEVRNQNADLRPLTSDLCPLTSSLIVMDEFTSVVDRTVAQIGSAALAKTVRQRGQKFIAVTCHEDVEDWLQPDWVYRPAPNFFAWGGFQGA